jgi:hypothetical protein
VHLSAAVEQAWPPFVLVTGLLLTGLVAHRDGPFEQTGRFLQGLGGPPVALLAACLLLVAVVTAVLNLDTAVVFLTPVLVHAARRRGIEEEAFLYGAVYMANASSLYLLGSNLTNPARPGPSADLRRHVRCTNARDGACCHARDCAGGVRALSPPAAGSRESTPPAHELGRARLGPATLLAPFLTSIAGVTTFQVLQVTHGGSVAPEWILGISMGLGGFLGSYTGTRLQRRVPEASLRRASWPNRLPGCRALLPNRHPAVHQPNACSRSQQINAQGKPRV